ncbi:MULTISPECIES: lipoprotein [Bacillus]|uniref:Lipoprotein n=3 Tax=Bacillus anthracis TaxID=1392 RepID=A0A6H3ADB7_BACAN|nr:MULTISPECIES: lipoprotein [Bacillus]EJT18308.1 Lipoprotein [Bacillus anthracis str. UR-1]AAP27188.1 putative lipoprotein [Bacillus anthracis str. Ames]AAT32527.1 putative lipoprotein [Bacillus anthracis str. 'Ames Ancestor']AAT55476.1 lipoprotein, putative [Bacillus anthracis str. Sterne]ACP13624.1 putative lipoprotein [Bacillus anthracis str. CDC 684]
MELRDVIKQKLAVLLFTGIILSGCSTIAENSLETGNGSMELLTPTITTKDNELEIKTEGIDENKVTFIYVANKKVLEQKLKNGESYKLNIKDIEHAHRTDYKPKVQLLQTKDDNDDGEIVTFKQVRYAVKN